MPDNLRFLISTAISILELLEDNIHDDKNRLLILDTIEILRMHRMKIDSAKLKNHDYIIANEDLKNLSENLKTLTEKLQTELHETETRLQYIGHIASLIKKLY